MNKNRSNFRKRTQQDNCLLCLQNKATKTKSHIIMKSFANSFLTSKERKILVNKGHMITKTGIIKNPIQDSPKENYIFCPGCEAFLGFIESAITPYLNNYHEEEISDAEIKDALNKLVAKQSEEINNNLFHLFFYSLIFRASISSHKVFQMFELPDEIIENIRTSIMDFYSKSGTELKGNLKNITFVKRLSYVLFACVNFPDDSVGCITGSSADKFHILVANKFAMFISNNETAHFPNFTWNINVPNKLVTLLQFKSWKRLFIDLHFELMFKR